MICVIDNRSNFICYLKIALNQVLTLYINWITTNQVGHLADFISRVHCSSIQTDTMIMSYQSTFGYFVLNFFFAIALSSPSNISDGESSGSNVVLPQGPGSMPLPANLIEWTKIYESLYKTNGRNISPDTLKASLIEIQRLEDTVEFKLSFLSKKLNPVRNPRTPFDMYMNECINMERQARNKKLIDSSVNSLTEALLKTFDPVKNDCFAETFRNMIELTKLIQSDSIAAQIMINSNARMEQCWFRYMNSFEAIANLLNGEIFGILDTIVERISLPPVTKPLSLFTPEAIQSKSDSLVPMLSNILENHTKERVANYSTVEIDVGDEFDELFAKPCDHIVQLSSFMMNEFNSFVQLFEKDQPFMSTSHKRLINRVRMCQILNSTLGKVESRTLSRWQINRRNQMRLS